MVVDKTLYPDVFSMYEERMKENGYCCVDFTEHISELKTIEDPKTGGKYILKFQLFWVDMDWCPWCGTYIHPDYENHKRDELD